MRVAPAPAIVFAACIALNAGPAQAQEFRLFANTAGATIKAKLVGVAGDMVTIVREDGQQFTLPLATLSPADQQFVRTAPAAVPAAPSASAPKGPAQPNDAIAADVLNAAAGQPLFGESSLWETLAADCAERLTLQPESKTKTQTSFRSYPRDDYRLFGARPFSVALYAENDKVVSLSLVFANKGDLFGEMEDPPKEAERILKGTMTKDLAAITETISAKLGPPTKERFGEGKVGRMNMQRWDWRGHAILLAEAEGEYVGIQVVPTAFADAGGKVARTSDAVIREKAMANLLRRSNGDVVISDIPMVDQGPKGYCAPATAERAMRYLGIPADMYVLANAGETGYGGGTALDLLLQGVGRQIRAKGRSLESWDGELKLRDLARHLDRGVPVMWGLHSTGTFNEIANRRTAERKDVTDWAAWKQKIAGESAANQLGKGLDFGHAALIIGYNKETGEIAFSDSWGEGFAERWVTIKEAEQVSQGSFYVVGL